jgi:CDP-diacylglycerol---glycerol-3-phosphate 3-phosphatidyltransferase
MKKHIPNSLTLFRIVLVPFFVWFAFFDVHKHNFLWAAIIFIVASITDYYDGMLARRLKVVSNFGKIMDPLADKILITAALVALAMPKVNLISWIAVIIIIVREIIVSIFRSHYARNGIFVSANIWGKLKTVLQMIGVISALVYKAVFIHFTMSIMGYFITAFHFYFWLVAAVTIISGFSFFGNAKKFKEKEK